MQLYVVNWKLSPAILEARLETVAQLSLLVTPGSTVNACIPRIIHFCFGEAK